MNVVKFSVTKENYFDIYLDVESMRDRGELDISKDVIELEFKDLDLMPSDVLKFFNGFFGLKIDTYLQNEYYTNENIDKIKEWYKDLVDFTLFSPFCNFFTSMFKFIDYYNGYLPKEKVLNINDRIFNELSEYIREYIKEQMGSELAVESVNS